MKFPAIVLALSLGVLPLLCSAYPNQYKETRFYANHGRKIEELEKKTKEKGMKGRKLERLQKKIETEKETHDALIDREIASLQEQRKDLFSGRKEADLPKFPVWEQEKIKSIELDLQRLAAFRERKDFKAAPIGKGKEAKKTEKTEKETKKK